MGERRNKDTNQADAIAIQILVDVIKWFNESRRENWNDGYHLWSALSSQQKDLIIGIRDEGRSALKKTSQTTITETAIILKYLKVTENIVKPPRDKEGKIIQIRHL